MINYIYDKNGAAIWILEWFPNSPGGSIFFPDHSLRSLSVESFAHEVWELTKNHFEHCKTKSIDFKTAHAPDRKLLKRVLNCDCACVIHNISSGEFKLQRVSFSNNSPNSMEREQPEFNLLNLDEEKEFLRKLSKVLGVQCGEDGCV